MPMIPLLPITLHQLLPPPPHTQYHPAGTQGFKYSTTCNTAVSLVIVMLYFLLHNIATTITITTTRYEL